MLDKNKEKLRAKKFSNNWNGVKPINRIIPNKKRNRKEKHNRRLEKDAYLCFI